MASFCLAKPAQVLLSTCNAHAALSQQTTASDIMNMGSSCPRTERYLKPVSMLHEIVNVHVAEALHGDQGLLHPLRGTD